jgi:hypothetical protein
VTPRVEGLELGRWRSCRLVLGAGAFSHACECTRRLDRRSPEAVPFRGYKQSG